MAARSPGHGEVEHLSGEDEGCGDAQQRHLPLVQIAVGAPQRNPDRGARDDGSGRRDLPGQEAVRYVHDLSS
jgi:hypothetical protein